MRHRQQEGLLPVQPAISGLVLAFRTMPVLARMVTVEALIALVTVVDVTPQGLGPALFDGLHRLALAREQLLGKFLTIGRAVLAEDVGQLAHVRSSTS